MLKLDQLVIVRFTYILQVCYRVKNQYLTSYIVKSLYFVFALPWRCFLITYLALPLFLSLLPYVFPLPCISLLLPYIFLAFPFIPCLYIAFMCIALPLPQLSFHCHSMSIKIKCCLTLPCLAELYKFFNFSFSCKGKPNCAHS